MIWILSIFQLLGIGLVVADTVPPWVGLTTPAAMLAFWIWATAIKNPPVWVRYGELDASLKREALLIEENKQLRGTGRDAVNQARQALKTAETALDNVLRSGLQ